MCGSRLYRTWMNMKRRCYSEIEVGYVNYGERGITVCDEWRYSFVSFMRWALANGYTDKLEIDRINVNGNYEPSNCRFVTSAQNLTNRRKHKHGITSKYKGVSKNKNRKTYRAMIAGKHIGQFFTEIGAARAYDNKAKELYGDFALLNFPIKTA